MPLNPNPPFNSSPFCLGRNCCDCRDSLGVTECCDTEVSEGPLGWGIRQNCVLGHARAVVANGENCDLTVRLMGIDYCKCGRGVTK